MANFISNSIEDRPSAGQAGEKTRKHGENEKKREQSRKNEKKVHLPPLALTHPFRIPEWLGAALF